MYFLYIYTFILAFNIIVKISAKKAMYALTGIRPCIVEIQCVTNIPSYQF